MRILLRLAVAGVIVALALAVLGFADLLVWPAQHKAAMASTIPSCGGRVVAEGLTYKFSDPDPGDVVVHAARNPDGEIVPDEDADEIDLVLRVAAEPKDEIEGRDGSVFVNGVQFDEIETAPFEKVTLGGDQYFVLGDNRSGALDSRDFGPIPKDAIYARALLVVWPLRDIGTLRDRLTGAPPGPADC